MTPQGAAALAPYLPYSDAVKISEVWGGSDAAGLI